MRARYARANEHLADKERIGRLVNAAYAYGQQRRAVRRRLAAMTPAELAAEGARLAAAMRMHADAEERAGKPALARALRKVADTLA